MDILNLIFLSHCGGLAYSRLVSFRCTDRAHLIYRRNMLTHPYNMYRYTYVEKHTHNRALACRKGVGNATLPTPRSPFLLAEGQETLQGNGDR